MTAVQPSGAPEFEPLPLVDFGTEEDLVQQAVAYGQAALPQWEPQTGDTEMVLYESLAMMLGVEVFAIQQLSGQVVEQLMGLYGVNRDPGHPAAGRALFTVTNSAPTQTIPAGTRLRYTVEATGETVDLLTVDVLNIITGETLTGEVTVTAELAGTTPNDTPAGTNLDVVDNLPFIQSVSLSQPLAGGSGEESDDLFFVRAASVLARLTSTLVSPESFQYAALTVAGIGRARVFDLYDPASPTVETVGHVSVVVTDAVGAALPQATMDELHQYLTEQALASLTIHVIEPTYTVVNPTVTVQATPGFTETQVRANVTAALTAWLDPAVWDFNDVVGQYAMIAVIAAAPGVKRVTTVPADQPLTGQAPLPTVGTIAVTVTA